MIFQSIFVQSHQGYRGEEYPIAFTFQDRDWHIESISDRWYDGPARAGDPILNYFKIKTVEGAEFLLRYNPRFNTWAILLV